jgi:RNA polymerase sigma-70 factor (ECF subfamily)
MMMERADVLQAMIGTQPAEDREEARQIARAQSGDEAAIDWLLARYRCRVVRLAAHILRRPADAEDAAQEAFVRAFRNLHAFRGQGRFYTWLYQIVVRVCLDLRRLSRWSAETYLEDQPEILERGDTGLASIDSRLLVEALLDRISPPIRATLVLRELEGLEYEEIARVMQIPVGRVRWRLHAARTEFQKLLRAVMKETEDVQDAR